MAGLVACAGLTLVACGPSDANLTPLAAMQIQPAGIGSDLVTPETTTVPAEAPLSVPGDLALVDPSATSEVSFDDAVAEEAPVAFDDTDQVAAEIPTEPTDGLVDQSAPVTGPPVTEPPVTAPPVTAPPATVPTTLDQSLVPPTVARRRVAAVARPAATPHPPVAAAAPTPAAAAGGLEWKIPSGPTVPAPAPATIAILGDEPWRGALVPRLDGWKLYRSNLDVQADASLFGAVRSALYAEMTTDPTRLYLVDEATISSPDPTIVMVLLRAGTGLTSSDAALRLAQDGVTRSGFVIDARNTATWLDRPATEVHLTSDTEERYLLVTTLPGDVLVVLQTTGARGFVSASSGVSATGGSTTASDSSVGAVHRLMATTLTLAP